MQHAFWVRGTIIFQLVTALIHSLSFFASQEPANPTEVELLALMSTYKMDMGQGFHRSMADIMVSLSACMTLLCAGSGLINLVLYRAGIEPHIMRQIMLVNALVFGAGLVVMVFFAFLGPIVCFALIWICAVMAVFMRPMAANASGTRT
ncbi:MAG: hypothetical protein MUF29_00900 [Chitinophagaceae bacterium]|jgi:hypothetical protein|nr:hypothetical protein [Chitinophagaceae bacterium]